MTQGSLPSLPLPLISALLCLLLAVLVGRLNPGSRWTPRFFSLLFAELALTALLVALRFAYSIETFILLQAILPLLTGPCLYLSFMALATPEDRLGPLAARHFGVVVIIVLAGQLMPSRLSAMDAAISLSYLSYAILLFRLWRRGPDALPLARFGMARRISDWMLWGIGLLLVLLVIDSAISVSFAMRRAGQATTLITLGSMLIIAALILLLIALPQFLDGNATEPRKAEHTTDEESLEAAARALLTETQIYLDPELSAQRLARRLHVPVRSLSAAINNSSGMNLSQYVNGFRLDHAAKLLRQSDDNVTSILTSSGFLTRSNFYREFGRVYGMTPAAYRKENKTAPDSLTLS